MIVLEELSGSGQFSRCDAIAFVPARGRSR
jgi:hypothetical protein